MRRDYLDNSRQKGGWARLVAMLIFSSVASLALAYRLPNSFSGEQNLGDTNAEHRQQQLKGHYAYPSQFSFGITACDSGRSDISDRPPRFHQRARTIHAISEFVRTHTLIQERQDTIVEASTGRMLHHP